MVRREYNSSERGRFPWNKAEDLRVMERAMGWHTKIQADIPPSQRNRLDSIRVFRTRFPRDKNHNSATNGMNNQLIIHLFMKIMIGNPKMEKMIVAVVVGK